MSDTPHDAAESGPRHRSIEIAVALLALLFGAIIIAGSLQVGVGWGVEGPKAGFFPFYVGLFILGGSLINLWMAWSEDGKRLFSTWGELRKVMSVVIPTGIYVLLVSPLGIYVSSALLMAVFMKWLGEYGWPLVLALAFGVPLFFFVVFERWFLIPLPKGPVENFLGF